MRKMIQDGMVAVVYSPHDSWSTRYGYEEMACDPILVKLVNKKDTDEIVAYCHRRYGIDFSLETAEDLVVEWIPQGSCFKIQNTPIGGEYLMQEVNWQVA